MICEIKEENGPTALRRRPKCLRPAKASGREGPVFANHRRMGRAGGIRAFNPRDEDADMTMSFTFRLGPCWWVSCKQRF